MSYNKTKTFEVGEKIDYQKGDKIRVFNEHGTPYLLEVIDFEGSDICLLERCGGRKIRRFSRAVLSRFTVGENAKLVNLLFDTKRELGDFEVVKNRAVINEAGDLFELFDEGIAEFFYKGNKEKLLKALGGLAALKERIFTLIVGMNPGQVSENIRAQVGENIPDILFTHARRIDQYVRFQELIGACIETLAKVEDEKEIN